MMEVIFASPISWNSSRCCHHHKERVVCPFLFLSRRRKIPSPSQSSTWQTNFLLFSLEQYNRIISTSHASPQQWVLGFPLCHLDRRHVLCERQHISETYCWYREKRNRRTRVSSLYVFSLHSNENYSRHGVDHDKMDAPIPMPASFNSWTWIEVAEVVIW